MRYELVAYGDVSNLSSLQDYQSSFGEGDKGYLDLQLASSTPDIVNHFITEIDSRLLYNIEGYHAEAYPSLVRIHFKVAIPPLAIIALAVAAVIIVLGLIASWKLYRLTPAVFFGFSIGMVFAITLAIAAAITLIMVLRKNLA